MAQATRFKLPSSNDSFILGTWGRSTALLFLLAMALHSYDALAQSAGEPTPHSTITATPQSTSLRGTAEEQALAKRRLALTNWPLWYSLPFWMYGLDTTGTPGMGMKPSPNLYNLWEQGADGLNGAFHGGDVKDGNADWF